MYSLIRNFGIVLGRSLEWWFEKYKVTNLFSLVIHKNETIKAICSKPFTDQAYEEFQDLLAELNSPQLSMNEGDQWSYIWNSSLCTSKKFYRLNILAIQPPRPLFWIWKTKCVLKIKVFAWLLFNERLNTRDMLDRRHCAKKDDDLSCVLCNGAQRETRLHLFFTCSFSISCWQHLGIVWNTSLNFFQMIVLARLRFGQKGFLEIFFIAAWHI